MFNIFLKKVNIVNVKNMLHSKNFQKFEKNDCFLLYKQSIFINKNY